MCINDYIILQLLKRVNRYHLLHPRNDPFIDLTPPNPHSDRVWWGLSVHATSIRRTRVGHIYINGILPQHHPIFLTSDLNLTSLFHIFFTLGLSSTRNMSSRHSYSSRTNTVKDIEKQVSQL